MILKNTDIKKFNELMKNREIICFGAGEQLEFFCKCCSVVSQIKYIIDNNPNKWNNVIEIAGQKKEILPPKQLSYLLNDRSTIVITTGLTGVEIIQQLKNMNLPEKQDVFWSFFIFSEIQSLKSMFYRPLNNIKITKKQIIPKVIHYCWIGNNPIPKEHQRYIDGWKRLCPDYKIICWNEKNYDIGKNQYMKQAYEAKKWGFVPDYIRKDVIYEYGGIYLDTDVEMIKRPDDLLYQNGFCSIGRIGNVNFGSGYGAIKGLPIIKDLRDIYNDKIFEFKKGMKIGPHFETEVFERYGFKKDFNRQIIGEITVYPCDVLSIHIPHSNKSFITENTYTVHHFANSWVDKNDINKKIDARELYNLFERV